jgi:hypothetical protein
MALRKLSRTGQPPAVPAASSSPPAEGRNSPSGVPCAGTNGPLAALRRGWVDSLGAAGGGRARTVPYSRKAVWPGSREWSCRGGVPGRVPRRGGEKSGRRVRESASSGKFRDGHRRHEHLPGSQRKAGTAVPVRAVARAGFRTARPSVRDIKSGARGGCIFRMIARSSGRPRSFGTPRPSPHGKNRPGRSASPLKLKRPAPVSRR